MNSDVECMPSTTETMYFGRFPAFSAQYRASHISPTNMMLMVANGVSQHPGLLFQPFCKSRHLRHGSAVAARS